MVWQRYLLITLASAILVVALTAGINIWVDPLGIIWESTTAEAKTRKPYLTHNRVLARWKRAERACAQGAIFGNSRAEIGFDPHSSGLQSYQNRVFNHAVPGSALDLAIRQQHWLRDIGCTPNLVIVGVEFFDDLGRLNRPAPVSHSNKPAITAEVLTQTVLSLKGLSDSITTVRMQHDEFAPSLTSLGFNPLKEYEVEVKLAGHYPLFHQRATENFKRWQTVVKGHLNTNPTPAHLGFVEEFLESSPPNGKTYLVIYPYHAQIRLMMDVLGLTSVFHNWKRELVAAAELAERNGHHIEVWDFSGLSEYTLESIPVLGDKKTRTQWYWEGGHFKKQLGDELLARMLSPAEGVGNWPKGWGLRLTSANLSTILADDTLAIAQLASSSSELTANVRRISAQSSKPQTR